MNFFFKLIKKGLKKIGILSVLPEECKTEIIEILKNCEYMGDDRDSTLEELILNHGEKIRKIWNKNLENKNKKIKDIDVKNAFLKGAKSIIKSTLKTNLTSKSLWTLMFCSHLCKYKFKFSDSQISQIFDISEGDGTEELPNFVKSYNSLSLKLCKGNAMVALLLILKEEDLVEKGHFISILAKYICFISKKDKEIKNEEDKKLPNLLNIFNRSFPVEFSTLKINIRKSKNDEAKNALKKFTEANSVKTLEAKDIIKICEKLKKIVIESKDKLIETEQELLTKVNNDIKYYVTFFTNVNVNIIVNEGLNEIEKLKSFTKEEISEKLKNILNRYVQIIKEEYKRTHAQYEYLASCILTYTREISDFIEKEIKIISKEEKIDKIYVDQMCIKIKNALLKCNGHIKSLEKENYSNVRFDVENYIYKNFFPKFTNKLWQEFTFLDEFDLHFDGLKEKHVKLYIIKSEHFHWAKGNSSLVFSNGLNGSDTKKLLEDGRKSKIKIVEVSFGLNLRDEKKKQIMSSLPMQEKFNTNFEGKNCKDFGVLFKIESSYEKRY